MKSAFLLFLLLSINICAAKSKTKDPMQSKECIEFEKALKAIRNDCKVDSDCFVMEFFDGCSEVTGNIAERSKAQKAWDKCHKKIEEAGLHFDCDQMRPHEYKCLDNACKWTPR